MNSTELFDGLVSYLTGQFPAAIELQYFWMAFQGCMVVRNGRNKDGSMYWFHAFMLSVVSGYGGSIFAPLWMGRPTSMLSNDLSLSFCIIAFVITNYMPFDLGYKAGKTLPFVIATTMFSQLFRTMGIVAYVGIGYHAFKDHPSGYYPIPVVGPILWASMLGNMGSFFVKGFDGHLQHGMPWAFQNGFTCATFYHFYVHDAKGPVGTTLRMAMAPVEQFLDVDRKTFAQVMVSGFMQICGILQTPYLMGPSFSPFVTGGNIIWSLYALITRPIRPLVDSKDGFPTPDGVIKAPKTTNGVYTSNSTPSPSTEQEVELTGKAKLKRKRTRRKNKSKTKGD